MNKPWASRPLALGGAVLGILAVATPAVQADPVKVKLVKSATVSVAGSPDSTFPFNNDQPSVSQFDCGKGYVPIAAGWKGTNTPTSGPGWFVGTKKNTTKLRQSMVSAMTPRRRRIKENMATVPSLFANGRRFCL